MLVGIERAALELQPDAMLVYGDTNSTLAGALVAAKLNLPLAHVEAGLRSFDMRMPEEVNRVVCDRLSAAAVLPVGDRRRRTWRPRASRAASSSSAT